MFITLEGPEGSGKTTAVEAAVKKLEEMGYQIVRTREPGGTPIAEQIRNVILDKGRGRPFSTPPARRRSGARWWRNRRAAGEN